MAMTHRFRVASTLAGKLVELGVLPADVLRHAGLPTGLFDRGPLRQIGQYGFSPGFRINAGGNGAACSTPGTGVRLLNRRKRSG
jgi:hypothetical protein